MGNQQSRQPKQSIDNKEIKEEGENILSLMNEGV